MKKDLLSELFQCEARAGVLRRLLVDRQVASVSELARSCELSVRAVAKEVEHLLDLGLIQVERVGRANHVSANWQHAACAMLAQLFTVGSPEPDDDRPVRESLASYGAPLVDAMPVAHYSLDETLVKSLALARNDSTVFRVLPVVLVKNRQQFDWEALQKSVRRDRLAAEFGMLLELTGQLAADDGLQAQAAAFLDRRRQRVRYFPEVRNRFERKLALERTPQVALKWKFYMNVTEDAVRSFLIKHCPELGVV